MKEYNYKFISSNVILGISLADTILFSSALIAISTYAFLSHTYFLLLGDVICIPFIAIGFFLLCKEVYIVKVYDDKIAFKALFQKEKVLYAAQIKNVYESYVMRIGNFYLFDTRDDAIGKASIDETELHKTGVLKFGYPFKIAVNDNTAKIVRELWDKPVLQVKQK